jgi:hypothetical protein
LAGCETLDGEALARFATGNSEVIRPSDAREMIS